MRMHGYATSVIKKGYTYTMQSKGFKASLMQALKLVDNGRAYGLPPGYELPVYPTDSLPGAPESWVRGEGSYVCPVSPEVGLWFDWTSNDSENTSVLPSVKGMNPITGQKLEGFALEQYKEKCPLHNEPFKGTRFCEKCNYKWPPQSYVSAPNTLWWDGFRQADGTVRQFFFTADEARDVASLVIGKQNTVPAFGFAFYEPKVRKAPPVRITRSAMNFETLGSPAGGIGMVKSMSIKKLSSGAGGCSAGPAPAPAVYYSAVACSADSEMKCLVGDDSGLEMGDEYGLTRGIALNSSAPVKDVSVGAGAIIDQDLTEDPTQLTDWKAEPSAIMRLYFVFEEQFKSIARGGVKDLEGDPKGYLKEVPVG